MDPTYITVDAKHLEKILANEISLNESLFFKNLTIDSRSLEVRPSDMMPTTTVAVVVTETTTLKPKPPRKCAKMELDYCKSLGHNVTTYPNIFSHRNIDEVLKKVIPFRELVSLL